MAMHIWYMYILLHEVQDYKWYPNEGWRNSVSDLRGASWRSWELSRVLILGCPSGSSGARETYLGLLNSLIGKILVAHETEETAEETEG